MGVAVVGRGEGPLVVGLRAVVQLLTEAGAQFGDQRRHRHPAGDQRGQPQGHGQRADIARDRIGHPRVLDLDGHVRAVGPHRTMDLADRGRGGRVLVELAELRAPSRSQLRFQHRADLGERQARVVLLQGAQGVLPRVVGVGGEQGVDGGEQLAELEGPALEATQRGPGVVGGRGAGLLAEYRAILSEDPLGLDRHGSADSPHREPGQRGAAADARRGHGHGPSIGLSAPGAGPVAAPAPGAIGCWSTLSARARRVSPRSRRKNT